MIASAYYYRLKQSTGRRRTATATAAEQNRPTAAIDPETGEIIED